MDGHLDYPHSLRVVNADGTDVRVLVVDDHSRSTLKQDVEWSPDGNLLAIAFDMAGIYTVRPDGSDFHLVIPGAYSPAWSPDGSLIAYSRTFENPDPGVWVANADGSNRRMISATGQVGPWNPGGSYP